MTRLLGIVLRLLIGVAIAVIAIPAAWSLLGQVAERGWSPRHPVAVAIGLGLGALWIFLKRPNWFVHTLIHEACHGLTCLLLGVRIHAFQATDGRGGAVLHDRVDPLRSTIIALAPYTLPLLLAPVLIALVLAPFGWWTAVLSGLAGFLLIDHLHGLWHNIRINFAGRQGDLARAGRVLALASIASSLLLVLAWWLVAVTAV